MLWVRSIYSGLMEQSEKNDHQRAFNLWVSINVVLPFLLHFFYKLITLPLFWSFLTGWSVASIMFGLNLWASIRLKGWRWLFAITNLLNLFAFGLVGYDAFVLAIPHLPWFIEQMMLLYEQSQT